MFYINDIFILMTYLYFPMFFLPFKLLEIPFDHHFFSVLRTSFSHFFLELVYW